MQAKQRPITIEHANKYNEVGQSEFTMQIKSLMLVRYQVNGRFLNFNLKF